MAKPYPLDDAHEYIDWRGWEIRRDAARERDYEIRKDEAVEWAS